MKRIILYAVLIVLLGTGAYAAGQQGAAVQPEEEVFKLWVWTPYLDKIDMNSVIVQRMQKTYNFEYDFHATKADMMEYQNLLIASGEIPDILGWGNFEDYYFKADQGVLAPIDVAMVKQYGPRYYAWVNKWGGEQAWKIMERDGTVYGLPHMWDIGPTNRVAAIRRDWLTNVGITALPRTIDELEKALEAFVTKDPDGDGQKNTYAWSMSSGGFIESMSFVFGAFGVTPKTFTEEGGKMVRGEVHPNAVRALEVLNRWYAKGIIDPEFVVDKTENTQEKWVRGRFGFAVSSWWDFIPEEAFYSGFYHDKLRAADPKAEVVILDTPAGPAGLSGFTQTPAQLYPGNFFGKHLADQPERMKRYLELFDLMFLDESYELMTKGVEGVTFKYSKETGYEWISPYDDVDKRWEYGIGYAFTMGSWNDYSFQAKFMTKPTLLPLRLEAATKGTGKVDALHVVEKEMWREYGDELTRLTEIAYIDFITGKRPISDFPKFVAEWYERGGTEVMKEAQDLYDRILK